MAADRFFDLKSLAGSCGVTFHQSTSRRRLLVPRA
jgi:hypothetical protein